MISNEVKERLKQKDWYVHCQTKQKSDLLLQACDEAGLRWSEGEKATGYCPQESYPFDIGIRQGSHGLYFDKYDMFEKSSAENITDWFFNAIKNNDSKLTPQNAEQEHMVQILLAIMQKIPVEVNIGGEWITSTILFPDMGYEYCIKPTPTPLHMSRWMWRKINKKWQFIAMDKDGQVFLYMKRPHPKRGEYGGYWYKGSAYCVEFPFYINTDGINWETSLTERPKDV